MDQELFAPNTKKERLLPSVKSSSIWRLIFLSVVRHSVVHPVHANG